jgi:hypothetical protein
MDLYVIAHMKSDIDEVSYILRRYKKYMDSTSYNIICLEKITRLHSSFLTRSVTNSSAMESLHLVKLRNILEEIKPVIETMKETKKQLNNLFKEFKLNSSSETAQEFKKVYTYTCLIIAKFESIHSV